MPAWFKPWISDEPLSSMVLLWALPAWAPTEDVSSWLDGKTYQA